MSAGIKQSISYIVDRINLSLTYRPCPADEVGWKMTLMRVSDDMLSFALSLLVDEV